MADLEILEGGRPGHIGDGVAGTRGAVDPIVGMESAPLAVGAIDAPRSDAQYLTRDQLAAINEAMTMGDTWRAMRDAQEDRRLSGLLSYLYAARRLGVVARDCDLDTFLDRVRQDDFVAIAGDKAQLAREGKSTAS